MSKTQMLTASSFFSLSSPSRVHFHKSIGEPKRIHQQSSFRMRKEAHFPNGLIRNPRRHIYSPQFFPIHATARAFPLTSALSQIPSSLLNLKFPFLTLTQRDTGSALTLKCIYQSNLSTEYPSDQCIIHTIQYICNLKGK